jgi:hypothetical protein
MANREVRLGKVENENFNIDYGIGDNVIASETAIREGLPKLAGRVLKIEKLPDGRISTTIETDTQEEFSYQASFLRKVKQVRLG